MNDRSWWLERYIGDQKDHPEHGEETCDHRYFVSELNVGWLWFTAAGRIERVTRMEPVDSSEYWWRIWTAHLTGGYSWRRRRQDRVHAIPRPWKAAPHLMFYDLPSGRSAGGSFASMHIVPNSPTDWMPDFTQALCEARSGGPGKGWTMTDRPDGGDEVTTSHTNKAKARTALLAAGRRHAQALGMTLYKENPDA